MIPIECQSVLHLCSFLLNTCVDPPHEQRVTSLTFQPDRSSPNSTELRRTAHDCVPPNDHHSLHPALAVSTSMDGKFKTWILIDGEGRGKKTPSWACRSVGYYHNLPCRSAVFCDDGSLLAVNFHKVGKPISSL